MSNVCLVCQSSEHVKEIAITVDGEKLRAAARLCPRHATTLILRLGAALGSVLATRYSDGERNLIETLELEEKAKP